MSEDVIFPSMSPAAARRYISAARNDAQHYDAEQNPFMAGLLRADADRLERHVFAVRPLVYRSGPVEVLIEADDAA